MTDTFKKLGQQQLASTSAITVYTVPALTSTIVRHIRLVNTDSVARTITLFDGGSGVGNTILPITTMQPGSVLEMDVFITMAAAGTLLAQAGTASTITITLYGMEIS